MSDLIKLQIATLSILLLTSLGAMADEAADELARKATDPTASLMSFNFIADYVGDYNGPPGLDDDSLDLTFRPAIPFTAWGRPNIMRLTIPYRSSGRGTHGLGAVTLFDIMLYDQSWGRFAIGGVASLARDGTAPDKLALGPAIGVVYQYSKILNFGVFNQNVFAGDTAVSQLQPIVAYQLGNGWSLSAGDVQWAYDFKNSEWLSLPIGVQLGKVTALGGQPVRWSVNPQYNLVDTEGSEGWSVNFTFTLLVPGS